MFVCTCAYKFLGDCRNMFDSLSVLALCVHVDGCFAGVNSAKRPALELFATAVVTEHSIST